MKKQITAIAIVLLTIQAGISQSLQQQWDNVSKEASDKLKQQNIDLNKLNTPAVQQQLDAAKKAASEKFQNTKIQSPVINNSVGKAVQPQLDAAVKVVNDKISGISGGKSLTNDDVIQGLKEALTVGTNNSAKLASKENGYYLNPMLYIPFPPEAQKVKDKMDALGLKSQTNKFILTLNRAAEEAAKNAAPVFINAVKGMSISDGFAILKGENNAATKYLQAVTTGELRGKFRPIVQAAINKVELTKYWAPLITAYNKIPLVTPQNPDLTGYVTEKAMAGLFKLIANEELKIRKDPVARITELLRKVFGSI